MKKVEILIFQILYVMKIVIFICLPFVIIGILYFIKKLNLIAQKIENIKNWFGVNPFLASSSKSRREWNTIEELLEENYQSSWKLAVIKAEALIQNFLKQLGYQGDKFEDLLNSLRRRGYRNLEILEQAHQLCLEIFNDDNFSLSQEEAKNIVQVYKKFWDELVENIL